MKRFIRNENSTASPAAKIIISLIALTYGLKANATDILEIIRQTANHPSFYSAQNNASAVLFDVDAVNAANNIQLSSGISAVGYSGQPGNENNPLSPYINVSKVLYDHGRVEAMAQGKQADYQMQKAQISVTRETLNQQVLGFYTVALTNAKVVKVLDEEIVALNDLLQRVKTIASIDPGRASEVNQVGTRLSSVIAGREASNTALQQAWQQLILLINHPVTLTQGLPDLKHLGLLPPNLEAAEKTLQVHPEMVLAGYRREASKAALAVASKWNRPTWNMQLTLNSPRVNGEMEPFKAATLQLSSDLNLWDGGKGIANQKSEAQRLISAEKEVEATARTLKQQLAQLWISLPLREQQISALQQQSRSAMRTWKAGETQFFAGQRPLTDLISFATDYYSSLASYEEQRVQYLAAQWQIISSLGKLSELAKNIPSLAAEKITIAEIKKVSLQTAAINNKKTIMADEKSIQEFRDAVDKKENAVRVQPVKNDKTKERLAENSLRGWPW